MSLTHTALPTRDLPGYTRLPTPEDRHWKMFSIKGCPRPPDPSRDTEVLVARPRSDGTGETSPGAGCSRATLLPALTTAPQRSHRCPPPNRVGSGPLRVSRPDKGLLDAFPARTNHSWTPEPRATPKARRCPPTPAGDTHRRRKCGLDGPPERTRGGVPAGLCLDNQPQKRDMEDPRLPRKVPSVGAPPLEADVGSSPTPDPWFDLGLTCRSGDQNRRSPSRTECHPGPSAEVSQKFFPQEPPRSTERDRKDTHALSVVVGSEPLAPPSWGSGGERGLTGPAHGRDALGGPLVRSVKNRSRGGADTGWSRGCLDPVPTRYYVARSYRRWQSCPGGRGGKASFGEGGVGSTRGRDREDGGPRLPGKR